MSKTSKVTMQPVTPPEASAIRRIFAGATPSDVESYGFPATYGYDDELIQRFYGPSSSSISPDWEASGVTDSPEARKLAASTNHREAEKRRRQRINSHLDQLRRLLPCNSKTDKASLLAKVIQRVKELKQETSQITELETTPSESDEVTVVLSASGDSSGGPKTATFKASLCCEDRSDLIPGIVETLRSLRLRTLRAEMATLRGRFRNVLFVTGDEDHDAPAAELSVRLLQNALRSLVERSPADAANHRLKRQRF